MSDLQPGRGQVHRFERQAHDLLGSGPRARPGRFRAGLAQSPLPLFRSHRQLYVDLPARPSPGARPAHTPARLLRRRPLGDGSCADPHPVGRSGRCLRAWRRGVAGRFLGPRRFRPDARRCPDAAFLVQAGLFLRGSGSRGACPPRAVHASSRAVLSPPFPLGAPRGRASSARPGREAGAQGRGCSLLLEARATSSSCGRAQLRLAARSPSPSSLSGRAGRGRLCDRRPSPPSHHQNTRPTLASASVSRVFWSPSLAWPAAVARGPRWRDRAGRGAAAARRCVWALSTYLDGR